MRAAAGAGARQQLAIRLARGLAVRASSGGGAASSVCSRVCGICGAVQLGGQPRPLLASGVLDRMTDHGFRQWTRAIILMVSSIYLVRGAWLFWRAWQG